jgi:hypothetical protein
MYKNHCLQNNVQIRGNGTVVIPTKCVKGSVGEGETDKKVGDPTWRWSICVSEVLGHVNQ